MARCAPVLLLWALLGSVGAHRIQPTKLMTGASADAKRAVKSHPAGVADDEIKTVKAHKVDVAPQPASLAQNKADMTQQPAAKAESIPSAGRRSAGAFGTKVPRSMIIGGVAMSLVVFFIAIYMLMSRCMGTKKKKKRTGTASFNEMPGNRKQYLQDGHLIYEWDQSSAVATIYIKVPEGMTKAGLDIRFDKKSLQVGRVGKTPFMRGETFDEIADEESAWRLRANGELQIYLQKAEKADWPCVLIHKTAEKTMGGSMSGSASPRGALSSPRGSRENSS